MHIQDARVLPMRIGRPDTQDPSEVAMHRLLDAADDFLKEIAVADKPYRCGQLADRIGAGIARLIDAQNQALAKADQINH